MNTVKFICSEHGEQHLRDFVFAGIVLACGCWWQSVYEKGIVHSKDAQTPLPQQKGRIYV